ncbi:MAG: hypothetical protein AABW82_05340 [Nanoarchaeota archaeon]
MLVSLLDENLLYGRLSQSEFAGEEGEGWKVHDNSRLQSSYAPLPAPLNALDFTLRNDRGYYCAEIELVARNADIFKGLSKLLAKNWGKNWLGLNKNGVGYISGNGQKNLISLNAYNGDERGEPHYRYITLGDSGAIPRKYGDEKQFNDDLAAFSLVANTFIESVYRHNNISNPLLEKLSLSLALR